VPIFAAILRVPFSIIAPIILVVCAVGAYTVHNAFFEIALMVLFGVIGYVITKLQYPIAPLVLALVLGDQAESAFRQSMLLSQGDLSIFWSNWLVGAIMGLGVLLLLWPMVDFLARMRRKSSATVEVRN
jgi:putative tricarboxylic transport membrane protein